MRRWAWIGMLCVTVVGAVAGLRATHAGEQPDDQHAMKGLPGVAVVVEDLPKSATDAGLSVDQIQTDAELRLRVHGIPVLPQEDWKKTLGHPAYYVNVNVLSARPGELLVYSTQTELMQDCGPTARAVTVPWFHEAWHRHAELKTMSDEQYREWLTVGSVTATTWNEAELGRGTVADIRDTVRDCTDRFCNEYLKANPKK